MTTLIISVLLGMLLYFGLEFKAKGFKWAEFSLGFWTKDNWWNLVLTAFAIYAFIYAFGIPDMGLPQKGVAFLIGFSWNKFLDYMQDFLSKKTIL